MITQITLSSDASELLVTLSDGGQQAISAAHLRINAMDAWTRRERLLKGCIDLPPELCITFLKGMGNSGVNIGFSDGHEKAIYPYRYLQELALSQER